MEAEYREVPLSIVTKGDPREVDQAALERESGGKKVRVTIDKGLRNEVAGNQALINALTANTLVDAVVF